MKKYILEIIRQKWRLLSIILVLLLLNLASGIVVSSYLRPLVAELQAKWSNLRSLAARSSQADTVSLYQQGISDLTRLQIKIPEKRQFARVLSDLLESAASSDVEVGAISYKPFQVKEEHLLSYQLSLSVSGGYAAVKSYLADLHDNPELIVVDSVAFSNTDLLAEHVVMDLRMTVYLREDT